MLAELKYPCDCEGGYAHVSLFCSFALCVHCECVFVAARQGSRRVLHVYAIEKWLRSFDGKAS